MCMKRCSRCGQWLDRIAFTPNAKRSDGFQTYCRECQRAYVREHYALNREYYLAKAKRAKKKFRIAVQQQLAELKAVPCADCGGVFPPWVLDFDHVRGAKLLNVSRGYRVGLKRMLDEASKCEIVCSNCHRERTHKRLNAPIAQSG